MHTHPYFLRMLASFKESSDNIIPKELLVLLIAYRSNIDIEHIHKLLFTHKLNKLKKREALRKISLMIEDLFNIEDGMYLIKDDTYLSQECKKLIKIIKRRNILKNKKEIHVCFNTNVLQDKINLSNEIDLNNSEKPVPTRKNSLLQFVTIRKQNLNTQFTLLKPIVHKNTVYVYDYTNPLFKSLRRRSDLINPIKKIFVKFSDDSRPAIYRSREYNLRVQDSTKQISHIDYDEVSTWDDEEGENINSEESEDNGSISCNEWVDFDINDDINKNIKAPCLVNLSLKIVCNKKYSDIWLTLPLVKCDNPSQDVIKQILSETEMESQYLSNVYMVKESIINKILNNDC